MTEAEAPLAQGDDAQRVGPAEQAPQSGETPSNASGKAASGTIGADTDDAPDTVDEGKMRQEASTINNVHNLYAESALFGSDSRKPPTIGAIKAELIATALRAFCESEAFLRAQEILAKHGMVILLGGEGSGRYTAATALLSGWPKITLTHPVLSFSPTMAIADLARKGTLQDGRCYLVHDMRGDGRASAELRFELTRLRQVLTRIDARLVLTADVSAMFRGDFGELAVSWTPPEARVVFDRHFECSGLSLDVSDLERARLHAVSLTRPGDAAAFVARLVNGIDAAMHSQSDVDREQVRTWFEDKGKSLDEQLTIAAACFLDRVPERIFERCLSRLDQLVRHHDPDEHAPLATPTELREIRRTWAESEGLITTIEDDVAFSERLVAFRSPHMRNHALIEIWNRYGYGLIQPLRQWIRELVRDVSVDVRVQTAMGLALLAERRWPEVKESFLDPWSNDIAVNRAAAATTLSMMSASETLAPRALETAIAWSDRHGARRAMTAALAFAGPLSKRYQDVAFEQLWYLTTRGSQIADIARVAMSLMLSSTEGNRERTMTILRITASALRWTAKRESALELRDATSTALAILLAPSFSSDEFVIAELLRSRPKAVELVGPLLAEVLASAPHYHQGIDLLRQLLTELTAAADAEILAGGLGTAVFTPWSAEVQAILIPKIERDLARTAEDVELSRQVVSSFIHSIEAHRA